MTKTNKILLAVLGVLLLIAAILAGAIAARSGFFGARTIAQPYNETRYSGTIDQAEGLIDASDAVPVVLVVRFHDKGETGELTSPTLKRHSTLTKTGKHTYREEIVHGEGDDGVEWTFEPGADDAMNVSYTTPDGASASAELPQTDPEETAGEVGLNPKAPGAEPDGIEFPKGSFRSTGPLELVNTNDASNSISDDVVFRLSYDGKIFTVTYPGRRCYGVLEDTEPGKRVETISVGDCESGGTWHFTSGDPGGGTAEFTSADGSLTGDLKFSHSEWDDIDGEIGIARSGPVLDFYRDFTAGGADTETQAQGSCDPSEFASLVDGWSSDYTVVMYCDGEWASAGPWGTDNIGYYHFEDGEWEGLEPDGTGEITGFCYDADWVREQGAPEEFMDVLVACDR